MTELATVLATVILAVPVARWAVTHGDTAPVRRLRSIQAGSVNDYGTCMVIGLVVSVAVLAAA